MTNTPKTSPAQLAAVKRWEQANRENRRYRSYKSSARTFVRKYATTEDLNDLANMIELKLKGENV